MTNQQSWEMFSGDANDSCPPPWHNEANPCLSVFLDINHQFQCRISAEPSAKAFLEANASSLLHPEEAGFEAAGFLPFDPALSKETIESVLSDADMLMLARYQNGYGELTPSADEYSAQVGEAIRSAAGTLSERSQVNVLMAAYVSDLVKPLGPDDDTLGLMAVTKDAYRDVIGFMPGEFRGEDFPDFWACLVEWSDAVSRNGLPAIEVPTCPYEGAQKDFEMLVTSMLNETWARAPEEILEGANYLESVIEVQEAFLSDNLLKNVKKFLRGEAVELPGISRGGR